MNIKHFMPYIIKHLEHVVSLLVVFLMLVATALWPGKLFGHDIGSNATPDNNAKTTLVRPDNEQMHTLGLPANNDCELTQRDSASWTVTAHDGTDLGVVVSTAPYARHIKGFAGTTPLYLYINTQGHISQIAAAENAETPYFFKRAFEGTTPQWTGKSVTDASHANVDAISGATYSSKAIIANVQNTLAARSRAESATAPIPAIGWTRTIIVALVLLTGILITFKWRGHKWLRMVQLLLNVGILGFWCGQFLSLSLLRGWVANGLEPVASLPTLLVLGVAVIMPFIKRPHHYCSWVCPYGSLQELAGRLPFPKVHCSPKVYKTMSRIRITVFAIIMLLLWTAFWDIQVLNYEPFSAFMVNSAAPIVMVLACVFVVASCFVPNVWCKCLCPMGQLLNLSEK